MSSLPQSLFGQAGSILYSILLSFIICFSFVVFTLHLTNSKRPDKFYAYLSNWMFVLFVLSTILVAVKETDIFSEKDHPALWAYLDRMVYYIGVISRTVYTYISVLYLIGLILSGQSPDILGEYYEDVALVDKDFVYYLNDISKHFLFVILMIILFVLQPRINDKECEYRFSHFLYPTGFLTVYTVFFWIYYMITGDLIYKLTCATLTALISVMPMGCCLIHQFFRIADIKIRNKLFRNPTTTKGAAVL